jgi:phosphopantothenoylcysteine decarboxylase / phosphopantothenate---cysteine ligase
MRPFAGRTIVLGVTGGIAAYKAVMLARLLTQAGAQVDVVMTRSATQFVGPVTFEALTGRPVFEALIAAGHALDHIKLARRADLVLVAPATADFLARAAHGHADDLLTAILLATRAPVLLAPAMNDQMWAHPLVSENVAQLRRIGYTVVDPDDGPLAQGEGSGPGRLPEPETLLAHAGRTLGAEAHWRGRRVLVTAGPTREAIDPVRFLTNHSTGRMGVALAAAAWQRGADVTLIHGPLEVPRPVGVAMTSVTTTHQMRDAVAAALPSADVLIMAAAPADYAAATVAPAKLSKRDGAPLLSLALTETPDILRTTRDARRPGAVIVGFALETGDLDAKAARKLAEKELDLIVGNDATQEGAGFGTDTNVVTIYDRDGGREALPLASKAEVAHSILDRIARRLLEASQ